MNDIILWPHRQTDTTKTLSQVPNWLVVNRIPDEGTSHKISAYIFQGSCISLNLQLYINVTAVWLTQITIEITHRPGAVEPGGNGGKCPTTFLKVKKVPFLLD
jgi:hypothetical protein